MSTTFTTSIRPDLAWQPLLANGPDQLALVSAEDSPGLDGPLVEGHLYKLFVPGVSLRHLEIRRIGDVFEVRVLSGSGPDEWLLAREMLCAAAELTAAPVRDEDATRWSAETLRSKIDQDWVELQLRGHLEALLHHTAQDGVATIEGPIREFHIDEDSLEARVFCDDDEGYDWPTLCERYIAWARDVQYIEAYAGIALHVPQRLALTLVGDRQITACVFGPGIGYVLPAVDVVLCQAEPPITVPRAALLELLGGQGYTQIDALQGVSVAIADEDWDAFLARARASSVTLGSL